MGPCRAVAATEAPVALAIARPPFAFSIARRASVELSCFFAFFVQPALSLETTSAAALPGTVVLLLALSCIAASAVPASETWMSAESPALRLIKPFCAAATYAADFWVGSAGAVTSPPIAGFPTFSGAPTAPCTAVSPCGSAADEKPIPASIGTAMLNLPARAAFPLPNRGVASLEMPWLFRVGLAADRSAAAAKVDTAGASLQFGWVTSDSAPTASATRSWKLCATSFLASGCGAGVDSAIAGSTYHRHHNRAGRHAHASSA